MTITGIDIQETLSTQNAFLRTMPAPSLVIQTETGYGNKIGYFFNAAS
jgi:hypothetical protein